MNTYAIFRRNGWASPQLLERAAARSRRVGDEDMPDRVVDTVIVRPNPVTVGAVD